MASVPIAPASALRASLFIAGAIIATRRLDFGAGSAEGRTMPQHDAPAVAIAALPETFEGDLVLPGDERYDEARAVWNGMYDRRPAVIARCASVTDVVAALGAARAAGMAIAVRGG